MSGGLGTRFHMSERRQKQDNEQEPMTDAATAQRGTPTPVTTRARRPLALAPWSHVRHWRTQRINATHAAQCRWHAHLLPVHSAPCRARRLTLRAICLCPQSVASESAEETRLRSARRAPRPADSPADSPEHARGRRRSSTVVAKEHAAHVAARRGHRAGVRRARLARAVVRAAVARARGGDAAARGAAAAADFAVEPMPLALIAQRGGRRWASRLERACHIWWRDASGGGRVARGPAEWCVLRQRRRAMGTRRARDGRSSRLGAEGEGGGEGGGGEGGRW